MLEFLLAPSNLPFSVALGLMCALGLMEVVGLLMGFSASGPLDDLLPDFDTDVDLSADTDLSTDAADIGGGHSSFLATFFDWLSIGHVPTLVWLVMALLGFGSLGLIVQMLMVKFNGTFLSGGLASVPAFLGTLPLLHVVGKPLGRLFQDQTSAISQQDLVGKTAVITLGKAELGKPAQAKLQDEHGKTHYVLVEPSEAGQTFETGETVVLVEQSGAWFKGVRFE